MTSTEDSDKSQTWRLWCRLCAKDDVQGNINVFLKSEEHTTAASSGAAPAGGGGDLALATAISKYFRVKIKPGEELPEMICSECLTLVTSLVNFSERIARVQQLYFALQLCKQKQKEVNLKELRLRYDLLGEEEHVELGSLTEVYVDEKPKLKNEAEEETEVELENPLNEAEDKAEEPMVTEEQLSDEDEEVQDASPVHELEEDEEEQQLSDEEETEEKEKKTNSRHSRDKTRQCTICQCVCATTSALMRHMHKDHDQDFACPDCPKKFYSPWLLQRHVQQHLPLSERKIFPCSKCDKMFSSSASAQQHARIMHPDQSWRPIICEQCGVAVNTMTALKQHVVMHSEYASFECDVCKKCFKSSLRLRRHKDTCDSNKYICPECGMELNSKTTLNRHRLVHTDQMKHKCDYCERRFKRSYTLKNHLLIHTGLKPYSCDYCDRAFANSSNLRMHKKRMHPKEVAADDAAGGAKNYNRNVPNLEALKEFTKNKDNLVKVTSKKEGKGKGRRKKPLVNTDIDADPVIS